MRELINDVEHTIFPPLMRAIFDEVVGPHVIAVFCAQPNAGAIVQPQTAALRLFMRNLQPLAPPNALDPLVIDTPVRPAPQRGDLAIAVAPVLACEFDDVGGEPSFVLASLRRLALCRTVLVERCAGAALGDVQRVPDMVDALAAARGA